MELKRDELYYLDKLLAHSVTNEYMEFESVFGVRNRNFGFDKNRIKRIDFQRLLKHLHKTYSDSTKSHTFAANQWRFSTNTSLDIWLWRNSSYKYDLRFTIQDIDGGKNVINYCNFNKLSNVRHNIVYKKRYNWNNDEVRELNDIIQTQRLRIGKNVNATLDSSSYVRFNLNQEIELSSLDENSVDVEHSNLPHFMKQNIKLLIQDLDKHNLDQYLKTFR